jgi:ubiquinone/menaquinone biosynthesis C-methylase UbiE
MKTTITQYYDQLAPNYDSNRFGNSYGRFLHQQEEAILEHRLKPVNNLPVLDLGCGTGRFLKFATHGLDASTGMLEVAKQKFPDKTLQLGSAFTMPFESRSFGAVFSFHLLMHLSAPDLQALLAEAHRVLQPGGRFIFDFPSKSRRSLIGYRAANWHGANAYAMAEVTAAAEGQWKLEAASGILFFPLHRFPGFIRPWLMPIDTWLCRTFLKRYASYIVVILLKT